MKKALILPLLLLAAIVAKAQQVTFKMGYLPKTNYIINKDLKSSMSMAAPTAAGKDLVIASTTNTTALISTGARMPDNTIPLKLVSKINGVTTSMNGINIPTGPIANAKTEVYAKYSADGKLKIDSIAGKRINDSLVTTMTKMVDAIQNGVKFPTHPLKIGESFTQDVPFPVPVPGASGSSTATVNMTYKLISVAANIAAFEITETISATVNQATQGLNMQMTMTGMGSGTLSFDITKQFYTAMTNNLTLNIDMDTGNMNLKGKGTVTTVDRVSITGN